MPQAGHKSALCSYESIFRAHLFAGQCIVITGGGSGIGRCIAHEMSSLGGLVVLLGRKLEKLEKTSAEIRERGGEVDAFPLDIRDEELVKQTVSEIIKRHGPIHGLVNNAGGQFPSALCSISQKGFETVIRTNLVGGFLMAREVYRQSMQHHGGSIVNMAADMWRGMPGMGHSGAARAGMVNLTQTAAVEWAISGVRVNAVAPGWIASSGLDTYEGPVKAIIGRLRESVPLKRLGTEAEVSAAVCFLLSPAAAFITGAVLQIDGGAPLFNTLWPIAEHHRSQAFDGFPLSIRPKVLD